MGGLFSKKRKNSLQDRVTDEDRAILGLKMQRDKLKMASKRYESNIERNRELAKALLKDGKKERALLLLKRKKFIETLIVRISNQLEQIQQLICEIELAQLNHEVYEKLKQGNDALQSLNQKISVEDVEKILDDTREAAELQEEISSLISGQLTNTDLNEVEEEFTRLMEEQLPEVPTEALPERESPKRVSAKEDEPRSKKIALPAS
uniref:Charged multivesicular body protein 6 n=1 Tax=Acrobeloides nanus TaxID=290746 RepID=A0A914E1X2_9BILA